MRHILLSDMTLPLSDNSRENGLSFREKIETAKLLDRLHVDVIELAPIKNTRIDSLLVKSVATAVKNAAVALPVSPDLPGVDVAWAALKNACHPRLQLKAPMSAAQMEYFWHKKPAVMLDTIRQVIARCKELCPDVEFVAEDACRADSAFLTDAISAACESGATTVTVCDDAGLMLPEEMGAFLAVLKERLPILSELGLGVRISDTLGMANACAIEAIQAGATEIKTGCLPGVMATVAPLAQVLTVRGDVLDASCSLHQTELHRLLFQIDRMLRGEHNKRSAFEGIVRERDDATLTVHDELPAVRAAVQKLGYDLSEEDMAKVYEAFRAIADKKDEITARELDTMVASVAMQVPPTYTLESYVINCGSGIAASAHLRLLKNGSLMEGICLGDGSIDAAFLAMEQIIGHHYELDDFQLQSVTEGREAMGEALVRLRSEGRLYSGRGISTDIVGASIHAYISALNKIAYEEAAQ